MGRFGFVIHPISIAGDIARKYPIAGMLPDRVVEWGMRFMAVQEISHITGIRGLTGAEAEGWFIGCPLTPRQFLELDPEFVTRKITEAGQKAADLGAKIVGLGAFTSIAGDAGVTVARNLDIAVTTGNTYTVATAMEGTLVAADRMGIDIQQATVAVMGATGAIGQVCAEMMAAEGARLILIGRDENRLRDLAERIGGSTPPVVSVDGAAALREADVVITVTSAIDAIIKPEHLKRGAVVCDVARPRDVSRRVAEERDDILVIEGGVVAIPGEVEFNFDFGFPARTSYACMAETMILALEERYEDFSLGRDLELAKVHEIRRLAVKHGFRLAGFRSFERAVTDEQIDRIREAAQR
jgi:predicted amino acid dehydrogenase